ncbi:MAG TPA: ATP-binding protein [Bacilli bacterium]|nr:ATP-binding protein [Bacilli bacterium]
MELGKVISIDDENVVVKVGVDLNTIKDIADKYVYFIKNDIKIIGNITRVNSDSIYISLKGEIKDDIFLVGLLTKPLFGDICYLLNDTDVINKLIRSNNDSKELLVGKLPLLNYEDARIPINGLFSNHLAIFGNTGSGKSCGLARILQNTFFNTDTPPKNSTIFIFDVYGEYEKAFDFPNSQIGFKKYYTDIKTQDNLIKIPLWLLNLDDFALLLNVNDQTQLPIIEKALRLVTVFAKNDENTRIYKNDIIAKTLLDILHSGMAASQIHDQVISILTSFNTTDLNLESPVVQPGYTRSLRQCLIIDASGKMNEISLVTEFINKFVRKDLKLQLPNGDSYFSLEDLRDAFDFALISEGMLKSDRVYDKINILKIRLESLISSEYATYFRFDEYISKKDYIKSLLMIDDNKRAQLININLNYLDDRFAKIITKIYAKMLFEFTTLVNPRGSIPIHMIIEEAHRYIQNDNDINVLGYNIFDRITKEGRKYGMLLIMISQRPSELSETALSQCSNFFIFKMVHPYDIDFIKQMVPNITIEVSQKIKLLQPGTCISFGSSFPFPIILKFDIPSPTPLSENINIEKTWY